MPGEYGAVDDPINRVADWEHLLRTPDRVALEPRSNGEPPGEPGQRVVVISMPLQPLKGLPQRIFSTQGANATSDEKIDCRGFNRLHVDVIVTGTTPSATITVMSLVGGTPLAAVPDSNGTQAAVTASTGFDCIVGAEEVTIRISSISGTFPSGQGYTIIATPYVG